MLERLKLGILSFSTLIVVYGLVGGFLEKVSAGDETYRDLAVFTRVLDRVQNDYVETPDLAKAEQGALQGMLEALDPFSSYVDAEVYQELQPVEGMGRVGLVLSKRAGYASVVAVSKDSPAEQNGLRTGDLVESIEGKQTSLMSLWEAQRRLAGADGSQVRLRVLRSRRTEPHEIVLVRRLLETPKVSAHIIQNEAGYLRIPSFEADAVEAVRAKLKLLESSGVQGLLIDLRGSADGTLENAVAVSDLFLPKGVKIVSVLSKSGSPVEESVSAEDPLVSGLPIVLLIDGGSSGAAEVFAAALVDNGVAEAVGERTNGFGSGQETFQLPDGSVLMISTRLHRRPNGEMIQSEEARKSGVEPKVLSPDRDFVTSFYYDNTPEADEEDLDEDFYRRLDAAIEGEQMEQAVKILTAKISQAKPEQKIAA